MPVLPFVGLALSVCEKMEICDKAGQSMVMRFCKLYDPLKIAAIMKRAQQFPWWQKNPKAAFMKAVGDINRLQKLIKEKQ
jgi:hypothetical protein